MSGLTEPLAVLRQLPTTMMWRGEFDPAIQYIKNDVVLSPLNLITYICIVFSAALGQDPSISADWFAFSGAIGSIHTVQFGDGLENSGTATSLIVDNTGVQEVIAGQSIFLSGTPQNTIINSIAVNGFIGGLGILINGEEIINDGIRNIETGGGTYLESPPPNAKLSLNSILSVTAGAGLLNVGTAQNPVLQNEWVRTATLNDIQNTGTANDLILVSDGVESITNTDGTLQISNFAQTVTIGCVQVPQILQVCSQATIAPIGWPATSSSVGILNFTSISSLLNNALADGATARITFLLTSVCIRVGGVPFSGRGAIRALDSTTGTAVQFGDLATNNILTAVYPFDMSFGSYSTSITALRAAGLRALTGFSFGPVNPQQWSLLSFGPIYAVWENG